MQRSLRSSAFVSFCLALGFVSTATADTPHLPGLTPDEIAAFQAGQPLFDQIDTPEGGLGPIFNKQNCSGCHSVPVSGGFGTIMVVRFGHAMDANSDGVYDSFDSLDALGGSLRQEFANDPDNCLETVPPEANVTAFRITPGTLGFGLIEAIPDADILAQEDPDDLDGDGVSGRAHMVVDAASGDTRVGRFGWKSQVATLLTFSGDALRNEQGVTNRLFPTENAPNGDEEALEFCDSVEDPEDTADENGLDRIDHLAAFQRLSAPPAGQDISNPNGFEVFKAVGCADCHTPIYLTGDSDVRAIASRTVRPFSDFLLHELGSDLQDNIQQGDGQMSEMRTAPLWDAHTKTQFMHDGRATTLEDAIFAHVGLNFDGEAVNSVLAYFDLTQEQIDDLYEFIGSTKTPLCDTGDVDLSGDIDLDDVDDFIGVLLNGADAVEPHCSADMNQDDYVDGQDVPLFVNALLGG